MNKPPERAVLLSANGNRVIADRLMIARTFRDRSVGLLGRPPLALREALWLDPCGGIHTWGMRYPIDVVFLDRRLNVLRVRRAVPPWRLVFAPSGTRSVIEMPAGGADGLRVGERVSVDAAPRR